MDKDSTAASAAQAPAYVSVSMPKPKDHTTAMSDVRILYSNLDDLANEVDIKCWPP
jgi:hypothetical protein